MSIYGLSSLHDWLERIHGNLERKEMLKARFAALILPIFEAYAFLTVMRQFFFQSSINKSKDNQPDLLKKASFLAFNTLFAGYRGFKAPHKCYQSYQHWGLTKDTSIDKVEIQDELIIKPDFPKETPKAYPEIEEDLEVENQVEVITPLKAAKSQLTVPVAKPKSGWLQKIKVRSLIEKLQNAPSSLNKRSSFQLNRTAIVNRAQSRSVFTKKTPKNFPNEEKSILSHPFPHGRSHLKLLELFSSAELKEVVEEKDLKERVETKADQKIKTIESLAFKFTENQEGPPDERLISIFDLISRLIPKRGSWKIKDQKITFNQSKSFHFDPYIVDKLAKVQKDGLLSFLTFDQALMLNQNLLIIDAYLTTKRSNQVDKILAVTTATQNRLVELWVSQDYHEGRLYAKCGRLATKIIDLIKEGKGQEEDESAKLFKKKYSLDFFDRFEEWQFHHLFPKYKKHALEFTIHDFYHTLAVYLRNLPEAIITSWGPLKETITLNELLTQIQQLSETDQIFVTKLLTMLHCAFTHIWPGNLAAMLEEVPELTSLICPNSLKALLENFQLLEPVQNLLNR